MKEKWIVAWRIIVAMGMLCIIILTTLLLYKLYERSSQNKIHTEAQRYNNEYVFEYKDQSVRSKDIATGKYLSEKMSYVHNDGQVRDTLTVFYQNGMRGFLNVYTGKIEIPAQYERAWVFSEGLGAVVKNGKLGFIDHKGKVVIPFQFTYLKDNKNEVDFLFREGYCTVIGENKKQGLIDKTGKWVVEPQYDCFSKPEKGYRIIEKNTCYGLLDPNLNVLFEPVYDYGIELLDDGVLVSKDRKKQLIAYDGKTVLQPLVFDEIGNVTYPTEQLGEDGQFINSSCNVRYYRMGGAYGLMDKSGKLITEPLYRDISGLSKEEIACWVGGDSFIVLDSKGRVKRN